MKLLKDMKSTIFQFFEAKYWYKTRKIDNKFCKVSSSKYICDTWNGMNTLYTWQLMKVEHMIYNLHKSGNEKNLYLCSSDITDYGTEDDRKMALIKMEQMLSKERLDDSIYLDDGYYITCKMIDHNRFKYIIAKSELVDTISPEKIRKNERKFTFRFEGEKRILIPLPKKIYAYVEVASFTDIDSLNTYIRNTLRLNHTFSELIFKHENRVDYKISDIHMMSPSLKKYLKGNIIKIRDLLKYRKIIKKLIKLDFIHSEPWRSESYKILIEAGNDNARMHENLQKLFCKFKAYRKTLLMEAVDLINNKGDTWWD